MPLCCASCWLWLSTGQPNATLILGEAPADFGPAGPRADPRWRSEKQVGRRKGATREELSQKRSRNIIGRRHAGVLDCGLQALGGH
jgi:hypothetical protein